MFRSAFRLTALCLTLATGLAACSGGSDRTGSDATQADRVADVVTGAGASFVYPLFSKWSSDYARLNGKRINYQSIGSGGGIAQIKAGTVDFGSSDKPLPTDELVKDGLVQFPSVIGGVVPVVNLPGID